MNDAAALDFARREAEHIKINRDAGKWQKLLMDYEKFFLDMHADIKVIRHKVEAQERKLEWTEERLREQELELNLQKQYLTRIKTVFAIMGGAVATTAAAIVAWFKSG